MTKTIRLIVRHRTSGGATLPQIDKGELLEVIEDGAKRPAKTPDPDVAFRWLEQNGYQPTSRPWLDPAGYMRRRAYTFERAEAACVQI